ncbi:MAG: hypothetical protein CM15mP25_6120 [Gammaproteobacteria bacterium]|nr:MAG: hypothetical protein CM15mP25_6120 [Gammaproteobacteria bacterium]
MRIIVPWPIPRFAGEDIGDAIGALDAAEASGSVVEATYEMPLLAHATLEPMNCIAQVEGDTCTIWSGTQYQSNDQEVIRGFWESPSRTSPSTDRSWVAASGAARVKPRITPLRR